MFVCLCVCEELSLPACMSNGVALMIATSSQSDVCLYQHIIKCVASTRACCCISCQGQSESGHPPQWLVDKAKSIITVKIYPCVSGVKFPPWLWYIKVMDVYRYIMANICNSTLSESLICVKLVRTWFLGLRIVGYIL